MRDREAGAYPSRRTLIVRLLPILIAEALFFIGLIALTFAF